MNVQHEAKLDMNEMSMLRWICGFNLKDNKKNSEVREQLGLDPVSLTITGVDCSGLDTLNIRMMQTGSSDV